MSLQASEHFKDVKKERNRAIDQLGKDLQCGVCQEVIVFVSPWYLLKLHLTFCSNTFCLFWFKAVSINCQHKFCHHCITTWKVNKMNCPICRSPLLYQGRDFVIDSVVKTWTSFLPEEEQIRRRELVQRRKSLMDIAGDLISGFWIRVWWRWFFCVEQWWWWWASCSHLTFSIEVFSICLFPSCVQWWKSDCNFLPQHFITNNEKFEKQCRFFIFTFPWTKLNFFFHSAFVYFLSFDWLFVFSHDYSPPVCSFSVGCMIFVY